MDCQQIRLGQGIVNLKYFREIVHCPVSTVQGKTSLLLESSSGINAHGNAISVILALSHGFDVLKVTNGPCEQLKIFYVSRLFRDRFAGHGNEAHVGAHNRSPLERDKVSIGCVSITGSLDRHVAQSNQILGNFHFEVESSFVIGLVEARERLSGITSLELSAHHVVMLAIRGGACRRRLSGLVFGSVETGHVVVYNAGKADGDDGLRWLKLFREFDGSPLRRLIVRNARRLERLRTYFKRTK